MHQPICLIDSSPSILQPSPHDASPFRYQLEKKHSYQSIPLRVLFRSLQVNITQCVHRSTPKPFINPYVQSVPLLPQLKPPNPSLFEYERKDFIHPSPLRIPPIQTYPCNLSMPVHRLTINLSTMRNPYGQSNVMLSSIHMFPESTPVYLSCPALCTHSLT